MVIKRAIKSKQKQRVTNLISVPSPFGGWNARDSQDLMSATDAVELENWIPRERYLELRNGFVKKVTIGTPVETLFAYEVAGNKKILAASNGEILELDTVTDNTTSLSSGGSSNQWQYILYKERIIAINGIDAPFTFNGTTVGATGFSGSGLTLTNLVNVTQFKNRLFFIEKGTLKFWYADAVGNITGTLLEFDLSQFSKLGGELISIDTWGQEDSQLILITSEGETFIYSGTDPSDATNWYLRDIYYIPKPLGYRSTQQVGGDLVIITQEGYFALSTVLPVQESNKAVAFSDKISGAVKDLRTSFSSFGWQIKLYSKGGYLLINVPVSNREINQHIMNTNSGSWSKFTEMEALCFENFDDGLYFGGRTGNVYLSDSGNTDDGALIDGYAQQAYTNLGSQNIKKFNSVTALISTNLDLDLELTFGVDFEVKQAGFQPSPPSTGALWDTFDWDTTFWGEGAEVIQRRIPLLSKIGYKASVGIKTQSQQGEIKWYSSIISFEVGKGIK